MRVLMYCDGINIELRPFTDMMPKCLLPIRKRSILYRNLDWLQKYNVEGVVISSSYRANQLKLSLDSYKTELPIHFHKPQKILGTAQTLKNLNYKFDNEPFVFLDGGTLYDFDLDNLYRDHMKSNKMISLICYRGKGNTKFRNLVKLNDKTSEVEKIIVKPGYNADFEVLMISGSFIANITIFNKIKDTSHNIFDQVFPEHVNDLGVIVDSNIEVFDNSNDFIKKSNSWSSCEFVYY